MHLPRSLTQPPPDHGILQAAGDVDDGAALGGAEALGREVVAAEAADEDAVAAAGAEGKLPPPRGAVGAVGDCEQVEKLRSPLWSFSEKRAPHL